MIKASCKQYRLIRTELSGISAFVEKWHYSHSVNGVHSEYCFGLLDEQDNLIGAMIYGKPAMANQWKKYGEREQDVIELRRLCCIDDTLRNTESYFIGKTLKWLKANTNIKTVISYSDLNQGHQGTIYKASNFEYKGQTAKGKVILFEGKAYHDKSIRTKYKGELKPFAQRLKDALANGTAKYIEQKPKNIYVYQLRTK